MNDILNVLLTRIVELEQEKNQIISNADNDDSLESNDNLAQFVNSNIDSEFKKEIFRSRLAIVYGKLRLFYFDKKLYITIKDYGIGLLYDLKDFPKESENELDEAFKFIFMRAKPTTRYGTPIVTADMAVKGIGKIIDDYMYGKAEYQMFYLNS